MAAAGTPADLELGVAPLSALDLSVIDYVRGAAEAGFTSVGIRVEPVLDTDPAFPRDTRSSSFIELEQELRGNGLAVLDIEVFSVSPTTTQDAWLPVLEIGERLGARYLNVVGDHPDLHAFSDLVGQLTADARAFGIAPVLEPVAYRPLNDFGVAAEIADATGCHVELDLLHFLRTGAELELIERRPELFPLVQLCDAPAMLDRDDPALWEAAGPGAKEADLPVAESRAHRLLPGDGDAPIREIWSALGPSVPLSVEIPNHRLRGERSGSAYLRLLHDATNEAWQRVTAQS